MRHFKVWVRFASGPDQFIVMLEETRYACMCKAEAMYGAGNVLGCTDA